MARTLFQILIGITFMVLGVILFNHGTKKTESFKPRLIPWTFIGCGFIAFGVVLLVWVFPDVELPENFREFQRRNSRVPGA